MKNWVLPILLLLSVVTISAQINITAAVSDLSCHPNNGLIDGSIDLNVQGGVTPYQYNWLADDGTVLPSNSSQTELETGTYHVTVTDSNGDTAFSTYSLTMPTELKLSGIPRNPDCHSANGASNGSIDITPSGGTPGYIYSWTGTSSGIVPSHEDQSGLGEGTYTVIVTDRNGCSVETSWSLREPQIISILASTSDLDCNVASGRPNGSINVHVTGGAPGYVYTWTETNGGSGVDPSSEDQTGLTAGTYTLIVTDSNGCTQQDEYNLTEPDAVEISGAPTELLCNAASGAPTGAIDITASGGQGITEGDYAYSWTTVDGSGLDVTAADQTGLSVGTYTIVVTDVNGCTDTEAWTLGEPDAVVCVLESLIVGNGDNNILCAGGTGTINVTASGGMSPYSYSIDGGLTIQEEPIYELPAGTHTVTVIDANGCEATASITLSGPTPLEISGDVIHPTCSENRDGSIDITASGGTGNYTYIWTGANNVVSDEDQWNLGLGTFDVTVTDANGCTAEARYDLTSLQPLDFPVEIETHNEDCSEGNGNITIRFDDQLELEEVQFSLDGGTTWEAPIADNSGSISYDGLSAGEYNLQVRDANPGCVQDLGVFVIEQNAPFNISLDLTQSGICQNVSPVRLRGGLPLGGTYTGPGVVGDRFDAALAGTGIHYINYTYTNADGCRATVVDEIEVYFVEDVVLDVTICEDELPYDFDPHGTTENGCSFNRILNLTVFSSTPDEIYDVTIDHSDLPYLWKGQSISEAGAYINHVFDANGCGYDQVLNLTVTGISSTHNLTSLTTIYPNPAHNRIFIESENELDLIVTNKLEQVVDNRRIAKGNNTISVSNWEAGLYFFQFSDDSNIWTERLVVK